jgi:serine phosphatase RsbU (regulator of sigma subunit)
MRIVKEKSGTDNAFSWKNNRDMRVENIINRFRLVFVFLIIALLVLFLFFLGDIIPASAGNILIAGVFLILVPLLFFIHKITLIKTYKKWLKYLTTTLDLIIAFLIGLPVILDKELLISLSKLDYTLLVSFVFILFNSLSVLRLNKNIVIYSASLAIILNLFLYTIQGELIYAGLYTTLFIGLLSVFNIWITNYLLDYYEVNNKLTSAYSDLQRANENINQKNEEITAQSEQIMKQIESLESIQKDHTDSLIYAQKIQKALIDNESLFNQNFKDFFIYFKPKSLVTGDFYWISKANDKIVMAVSDCTGHGVPGAFMTMLGYSFLNEIVNKEHITEPDLILNELRENVISTLHQEGKIYEQKDGMDMAIVMIDKKNKRLKFSAANNSICYIPTRDDVDDKKVIEFKGDRMPISFHYKMRRFSLLEFDIREGDKFYLYTDGFIDQFGGPKGKKFKSVPFRRMLLKNHSLPMTEQREILEKTMEDWLDDIYEQVDDMTIIGFEI